MKHYKENTVSFGYSDVAFLTAIGGGEDGKPKAEFIRFAGDGTYKAYLVDNREIIPSHYRKICEFENWVRVYDDTELIYEINVKKTEIYRAGDYGLLIYTDSRRN